jgi:hypothetical protein
MTTTKNKRTTTTSASSPSTTEMPPQVAIDAEQRRARIAVAAFYMAANRGFKPGGDVEDWLAAERLIDEQMARQTP